MLIQKLFGVSNRSRLQFDADFTVANNVIGQSVVAAFSPANPPIGLVCLLRVDENLDILHYRSVVLEAEHLAPLNQEDAPIALGGFVSSATGTDFQTRGQTFQPVVRERTAISHSSQVAPTGYENKGENDDRQHPGEGAGQPVQA